MMLAFSFCDSHLHLSQVSELPDSLLGCGKYFACSCALNKIEYEKQKAVIDNLSESMAAHSVILNAFGLHPQQIDSNADLKIEYLEKLLCAGNIDAVGEIGFDYFNRPEKCDKEKQEKYWNLQVELAIKYRKPIVVHSRKAMSLIFRESLLLKRTSSVIFHSFEGSSAEAASLMHRGINCYFSFGKTILKGDKSAIQCVKDLPPNRILFETDAPFQILKGQKETRLADIKAVYEKAILLRPELSHNIIEENFKDAFCIP